MDKDAQIKTLLEEANNAKEWFVKYADELKCDPSNERLLRLQELCRHEFEKRPNMLADLGVAWSPMGGAIKRPPINQ
jgi:hypothetical protein